MKKILIAGEKHQTGNYEHALAALQVHAVTSLNVPDVAEYDALLLPGGGDIDPKLFGQLPCGTKSFHPELDRIQLQILKAFARYRKPILGICKGMQLINIAFGGDMIQHLPTASLHEYKEKDQLHLVKNEKDSFFYQLYGEQMLVNSAHHQGVGIPGKEIRYIQQAQDGVIEGLCHTFLPILGTQWHPERLSTEVCRGDSSEGKVVLEKMMQEFLKSA